MRNELRVSLLVGVTLIVSGCSPGGQSEVAAAAAAEQAGADEIPAFVFDPTWPKTPLPNNWMFGNIAGVHVDGLDQIWVLQRGNTVEFDLGDDYLARGWGDCCQPAPSVVVFDQDGNVVKAWGGDPTRATRRASGRQTGTTGPGSTVSSWTTRAMCGLAVTKVWPIG